MKPTKYLIFLLAFVVLACEEPNSSTQDSTVDNPAGAIANEAQAPKVPDSVYTVTNDFQEYNGQEMTTAVLYLRSLNTGESYIIPPTEYEPVALTNFIIDIKVSGDCVEVPAHAFPVMVGVCQSEQCDSVRPLNMVLSQPAHYNLSGIGGLLTPAMSPYSPCSKEYFEQVELLQTYQKI